MIRVESEIPGKPPYPQPREPLYGLGSRALRELGTLLRAERLTVDWLTECVREVIAPQAIDRLRERRMASWPLASVRRATTYRQVQGDRPYRRRSANSDAIQPLSWLLPGGIR